MFRASVTGIDYDVFMVRVPYAPGLLSMETETVTGYVVPLLGTLGT